MKTIAIRTLALLAALLISAPAWAQARYVGTDNAFRVRLGLFEPEGDSQYWDDKQIDFTGEPADFENVSLGADFRLGLAPFASLLVSGDVYSGEEDQSYFDFVDDLGVPITHTTTLDIASVTGGVLLHGPRHWAVIPYAGAGGGFYFWSLEESGDFIDFFPSQPEIFSATFEDSGEAVGYYWMAGLEVPVGMRWSFFGEARWQQVEDELGGDFADLGDLDLSGRQISAGASWRF
ncbi:MAG TPA: outer membrane beta-barrel protein [Thermoanaerobaculia bacterium]|nr:outer membrane beta-barrel protein [Thermoanaerobaculia bacterium]